MTRDELIRKYIKKSDIANLKAAELRRSYHKNKESNPEEAR